MTGNPYSIRPETNLGTLVHVLRASDLVRVPVVDAQDRLVGIKSREVYECPASLALILAHRDLEGEGAGGGGHDRERRAARPQAVGAAVRDVVLDPIGFVCDHVEIRA